MHIRQDEPLNNDARFTFFGNFCFSGRPMYFCMYFTINVTDAFKQIGEAQNEPGLVMRQLLSFWLCFRRNAS